jgi:hypothetical protein
MPRTINRLRTIRSVVLPGEVIATRSPRSRLTFSSIGMSAVMPVRFTASIESTSFWS